MRLGNRDVYASCPCGSGKKYKFCCLQADKKAAREEKPLRLLPRDDTGLSDRDIVYLDLEDGERLNAEGMRLMSRNDFRGAAEKFRASIDAAPLIPAAHNNLALVTYMQGEVVQAIRMQEQTLSDIPCENVFGMGNLVHFYLTAGRIAEAERLADEVAGLHPRDVSALGKMCEVFGRLRRHRRVLDAVEQYDGDLDGVANYFAGMAAANLELYEDACTYLRRVGRRGLHRSRARKHLRAIEAGKGSGTVEGNWPYFETQEILHRDLFAKMTDEAGNPAEGMVAVRENPTVVDAMASWLDATGGTEDDTGVIELLGSMNHPRGVELLTTIAEGTFGVDKLRMAAMQELVSKGIWNGDEPRTVWLNGKWTEVQNRPFGINPEAASAPMPEGMLPLYERGTTALRSGKWKKGEECWREFVVKEPTFFPAHHNLAVALLRQGHNAEAEKHLRMAMELATDYLFAPCTLAVLYLDEDRVAEAREVLDAVTVPEEIHPEAMICYCNAQTQVAIAEAEFDKAIGWLDMGAAIDPDNPGVRELQERLKIVRGVSGLREYVRRRRQKSMSRVRGRVLPREATLEECYGAYTKSDLAGMARAVGVDVGSRSKKKALLRTVCSALRDESTCRYVLLGLRPEERAALQNVLGSGGRMDYDAFTRIYRTDAEDMLAWDEAHPETVLGRLKCRGLLVEATVDRKPSAFVPAELQLNSM